MLGNESHELYMGYLIVFYNCFMTGGANYESKGGTPLPRVGPAF